VHGHGPNQGRFKITTLGSLGPSYALEGPQTSKVPARARSTRRYDCGVVRH
jgi:hypothetical protein